MFKETMFCAVTVISAPRWRCEMDVILAEKILFTRHCRYNRVSSVVWSLHHYRKYVETEQFCLLHASCQFKALAIMILLMKSLLLIVSPFVQLFRLLVNVSLRRPLSSFHFLRRYHIFCLSFCIHVWKISVVFFSWCLGHISSCLPCLELL